MKYFFIRSLIFGSFFFIISQKALAGHEYAFVEASHKAHRPSDASYTQAIARLVKRARRQQAADSFMTANKTLELARKKAQSRNKPQVEVRLLWQMAECAQAQQDSALTVKYYLEAQTLCRTGDLHHLSAQTKKRMADFHFENQHYPEAILHYDQAEGYFQKHDKAEILLDIFMSKGSAYAHEYQQPEAIKAFHNALAVAQNAENEVELAKIHDKLGKIYNSTKVFYEAHDHLIKTVRIYRTLNDTLKLGIAYYDIGMNLNDAADFADGRKYLRKSLDIFKELKRKDQEMRVINGIGLIYANEKKLDRARKNFRRVLHYLKSKGDTLKAQSFELNLCLSYLYEDRYDSAKIYAQSAIEAIKRIDVELRYQFTAYRHLYQACKGLGQYEEAFSAFKKYNQLKKQFASKKDSKRSSSLANYYRYKQRTDSLKEAQLRKELKLNAEKAQQRLYIYGILGFALLVLGALMAALKVSRRERKNRQQIEAQKDQIEGLGQDKDRLLTIIAHDLKSPMHQLHMMLVQLQAQNFSQKQFESYVPALSQQLFYTRRLMNNLIEWARLQQKGIKPQKQSFSIDRLVAEEIQQLEKTADEKSIDLQLHNRTSKKPIADKGMVALVVRNFLTNAVKFSYHESRIRVVIDELSGSRMKISVIDHGVGMDTQAKYQLTGDGLYTTEGTDNEKGIGLGLKISREFVRINGGEFGVDSQPGKGSCFWFTLAASTERVREESHPIAEVSY